MRKNFVKKSIAVMAMVTSMAALLTGCNTKIKVDFGCNAADYVKVSQYKGIEATIDATAITKKLVDEKIQNDLDSVTAYSEIDRESQEDDQVTVSFTGSIGGTQIDGFSSDSYSLVLGRDTFNIPGFVEEMYGVKKGDTKIFTLVVPEGIADAEDYANKKIVYEVNVLMVEVPVVPMLTDAYAKENFGYDTFEAYKTGITADMQSTIDEQIEAAKYQAVMESLQENAEVTGYPEDILNTKREELRSSINFYALMYGMNEDEYCQSRYQMSFEEYVKKSLAQILIMQNIVAQEDLSITEYEYKGDLDAFADSNGFADEAAFVTKYGKDTIAENMLLQKASNLVMESANITVK